MSAAVTVGTGDQCLLYGAVCHLAQTRQGVKLTQNTDHRPAAAESPGERRLDPRHIAGHFKAFFFQLCT